MNILLINPPRWNEILGKNPSLIEKHRGFSLPLGLLYLVSAIKKFTDYQVEVLDTQPFQYTYSQLEDYFKKKSYDIVGISTMTFTLIDVYKTVRLIKKIMPKAKIILGGAHIHLYPYETISLEGVDFAFMGEADFSFIDFLKNLNNRGYYYKIPGLIYKDDGGKIIKNDFSSVNNLDEIPFPDRKSLNAKYYDSLLSRGSIATTIVSSRGCPYKCAFCDRPFSPITYHFRFRSTENVMTEIQECLELGIKDFLFYDDTFTINKNRVLEICEELIRRKIEIRWNIRTRVDTVDEQMLRLLKKAGCVAIHYGVEAGNDKLLRVIKKGFTISKVKESFKLTKKIGMETLAYFMIGLPQEDLNDILDTFNLAKELKPDYAHFTIFSPCPGTEFYELGLEKSIIKKDIWREFAKNPTAEFVIPVWEENFTREQLHEMLVKFYKKFYLRSSYILSHILKIRSKEELIKKTRAGLSVFFMQKEGIDKLV